jgi:hypothetical protein
MEHRTLIDPDGVVWDVWEVQPAANEHRVDAHPVPPPGQAERRRGRSRQSPKRAGWLALQNDTERRRVVPAPAGWREMTDDALVAVLRDARGTGRPLLVPDGAVAEITLPSRAVPEVDVPLTVVSDGEVPRRVASASPSSSSLVAAGPPEAKA